VFSVAPSALAPQVLLVSSVPGIYKSIDGGRTWRVVYQSPSKPYSCLGSVVVDPANPLHAAAWVGDGSFDAVLVRSVDGGETWTKTSVQGNCFAPTGGFGNDQLWADPADSGALLLVDLYGRFTISRDWGLTFQTLSLPDKGALAHIAFDPSHAGSMYVLSYNGNLFSSPDFGATWAKTNLAPKCSISGMTVDPDHSNTVVAIACSLYTSTDGGASWMLTPPSDSFLPAGQPVILSRQCPGGGNVIALGILPNTAPPAIELIGSSLDYGLTWSTRQVSNVGSVVSSGCTLYATRSLASDAFVAKLVPDGTTLWATFLGGSNADAPVALAVDSQGNAYVSGNTSSPDFPSTAPVLGVPEISNYSRTNAFVAKFSADGALLYSAVVGASSAGAIAVDTDQSAYLVGVTASPQFPVTPGALVVTLNNPFNGPAQTGFLLKLSPAGALSYATYLGGPYSFASGIVVNTPNQPILAGIGPVPGSPTQPPGSPVQFQGYVALLDVTATRVVRSVQLPANIVAIVVDVSGNLLVAGVDAIASTCGVSSLTKFGAADWRTIYNVPSWTT
jgi:hypothetical protein